MAFYFFIYLFTGIYFLLGLRWTGILMLKTLMIEMHMTAILNWQNSNLSMHVEASSRFSAF